jgi:hypothetical protein
VRRERDVPSSCHARDEDVDPCWDGAGRRRLRGQAVQRAATVGRVKNVLRRASQRPPPPATWCASARDRDEARPRRGWAPSCST